MKEIKTPDEWAREFKLHHCIGSKNFAKQIRRIQLETYLTARTDNNTEAKKRIYELEH